MNNTYWAVKHPDEKFPAMLVFETQEEAETWIRKTTETYQENATYQSKYVPIKLKEETQNG